MEEAEDFEGFAPEDCDLTLKLRTSIEQILNKLSYVNIARKKKKRRGRRRKNLPQAPKLEQVISGEPSGTSTVIEKKKKRRKRKLKSASSSTELSRGGTDQTDSLKFWHLKEYQSSDTPQTVLDHAHWFEKVMATSSDKENYMDLNYQQYVKLAGLEGSVNVIMFISASNMFTTQHLWEEHVHRITTRVSKRWIERELNTSPLFYLSPHGNVWERTGVKCQGGKSPTSSYNLVHWLGILEQRKVWAGLGPPNHILELRKECVKAIMQKYDLLTVEDIGKIICSSFHIPPCAELTELVYQTLSSSKIFHKSQDQDENIANSKNLADLGSRLGKTKRVPKPSKHYKRAIRTAALYKELLHGENITDPDLQTDGDGRENRLGISEIAWIPALEYESDEMEDQTLGTNEKCEKRTFDTSYQHQSPVSTQDIQLTEKNTPEQFNRNEWNKGELTGDHRTLPSCSMESVTGELSPSAETRALDCENITLEDSEKTHMSESLIQNETPERSISLSIDSASDGPESLLSLTTDTEFQVSEKNECNFDSASRDILNLPILQHYKKFEDVNSYRCHLFAKSCYNISVTDKIYQHTLPKRLTLITTGTLATPRDDFQRNIQMAHGTKEDHLSLEYKSSPILLSLNRSSEVTGAVMEKPSERLQNMDMKLNRDRSRITLTHRSQTNSTKLLNNGSSSAEDSGHITSYVSTRHSGEIFSKLREVRKVPIDLSSSSLGSFGPKPQHISSVGEIRKRYKSVPGRNLAPKAKQSECYQIIIKTSEGSAATDSSEVLITPKNVTKTLRSFRINKNLQHCRSLKETPTEKSSSLIVKAVDKSKSCIIIDLHEQDTLESIREAQDDIILPDHQRNETSHLRAQRTCNTLPAISDAIQGRENSSTVLLNADGPFKEGSLVKKNREASRSKVHITPHPNTEHSYSVKRNRLSYVKNITQASGSNIVVQQYKASKITSVTEVLNKMQNDRNIFASPIVSNDKSSTPEAPSITKVLVKLNVMGDDEVSERAGTHCITQDSSPVKISSNSLSRENETDKFCSAQTSDTPVMAKHVKAQQASIEEAPNIIQSNLKTMVPAGTFGSSDASTIVQNCLKSTTFMDSSVEHKEPERSCITQGGQTSSLTKLLENSEVNHNFERSNVNEYHGSSSAALDTITEQNNTNNPDNNKAIEHTSTDEHFGTSEVSCSSEDSTVIQNLTTSSSANLIPSTSLVNLERNDSIVNSNPLKRQRWKSFKLRDYYEEDFKIKPVKALRRGPPSSSLEELRKPLLMGWVREVVQRKTVTRSVSKDVYYHSPDRKKLRSYLEIASYLDDNKIKDLRLDNFSLFHDGLGFGEPYEIIRKAAVLRSSPSQGSLDHTPVGSPLRMFRRTFAARKALNPDPSGENCLIIDKFLPSDRFWVTGFEDLHNTMDTDNTEIVNEDGEMTGFEEWAPNRILKEEKDTSNTDESRIYNEYENTRITDERDPTSSSEALSAATTPCITTTSDTITSVSGDINTSNNTACFSTRFTISNGTITSHSCTKASVTVTDSCSLSPVSKITHSNTQEFMTTTSSLTTETSVTFSDRANTACALHDINMTSGLTFQPPVNISSSHIITSSINPTPTDPSLIHGSISTETNTDALSVDIMPEVPRQTPRSSSTATNTTMSLSDVKSTISSPSGEDTTFSQSHIVTSHGVHSEPNSITTEQPSQSFQPKILKIYNPTEAQRLFNMLETPTDPEVLNTNEQEANSGTTVPADPTGDMQNLTLAVESSSKQNFIPPNILGESHERNKHEYTYILPNLSVKKNYLRKVRVNSNRVIPPNTQQPSLHSVSVRQQQLTSVTGKGQQAGSSWGYSNTQKFTPAVDNGQRLTPVMSNREQPATAMDHRQHETSFVGYRQQQKSSMNNREQPMIAKDLKLDQLSSYGCRQHQTSSVSNREHPITVKNHRQHQTSFIGHRQQQTSTVSNREQPTTVKDHRQHQTSFMGHRQRQTLSVRNREPHQFPSLGHRQHQTSSVSNREQPTSIVDHRQHQTSLMGYRQQQMSSMSNREQPLIAMDHRKQQISSMSMRKYPALVKGHRQHQTSAMGHRHQQTPVIEDRQCLSLAFNNREKQPTLVMNNKQQTAPAIDDSQQPTSSIIYRQRSALAVSSRQQPTPPINNREHSDPVITNRHQSPMTVTGARTKGPMSVTDERQQPPAMCSRQQSTSGLSWRHEPSPVTSPCPRSTPVSMECAAPVVSMNQSVPVSDNIFQSPLVISHNQQSAPVTSSSQAVSFKKPLLPISHGKKSISHSVTKSTVDQPWGSSYLTETNRYVRQTPSTTDRMHHIIPESSNVFQTLPLESELCNMIPNRGHHNSVVNPANEPLPVVSSVSVVSSVNNNTLTVTNNSCVRKGSNTTTVNTNIQPQGRIKKQTARKSTKARVHKAKRSLDIKLFVDDGLLALESDSTLVAMNSNASESNNDIILSEPFSAVPVSMQPYSAEPSSTLQLQVENNTTNAAQNSSLSSSLPQLHPALNINLKTQESHNQQTSNNMTSQLPLVKNTQISSNTFIRPPPPLRLIPPQITRKVNKTTCPPLTPIRQMLSRPVFTNTTPNFLPTPSSQLPTMTPIFSSVQSSVSPPLAGPVSLYQTSNIFPSSVSALSSTPTIAPKQALQSQASTSASPSSSGDLPLVFIPGPSTASLNF